MALDASPIITAEQTEVDLSRSPLSFYGIDEKYVQRGCQIFCVNCNKIEQKRKTFKICLKCLQLKVEKYEPIFHYYCSVGCQREHWKIHRLEHFRYEKMRTHLLYREETDDQKAEREDDLPFDPDSKPTDENNSTTTHTDKPSLKVEKVSKKASSGDMKSVLTCDRASSPIGEHLELPEKVNFNLSAGMNSAQFCLGEKITESGGLFTSIVALLKQEITPDGTLTATTTPVYRENFRRPKNLWKPVVSMGKCPSENLEHCGNWKDAATSPPFKDELTACPVVRKSTGKVGGVPSSKIVQKDGETAIDITEVTPSKVTSVPFWLKNGLSACGFRLPLSTCVNLDEGTSTNLPTSVSLKSNMKKLLPQHYDLGVIQEEITVPEPTEVAQPKPEKGVKKPELTKKGTKPESVKKGAKPESTKDVKKPKPTKKVAKVEPTKKSVKAEAAKPDETPVPSKAIVNPKLKKKKREVKDVSTLSNKYVTVIDVNECPPLEPVNFETDTSSSGDDAGGYIMYILTDEDDGKRSAVVQKRKNKRKPKFNPRILFEKEHMKKKRSIPRKDGKPRQEVTFHIKHPSDDDEEEEDDEDSGVSGVSPSMKEISDIIASKSRESATAEKGITSPESKPSKSKDLAGIQTRKAAQASNVTKKKVGGSQSATKTSGSPATAASGHAAVDSNSTATASSVEKPKFDPAASLQSICEKINIAFGEEMPRPSRIVEVTLSDDEIEQTIKKKTTAYFNKLLKRHDKKPLNAPKSSKKEGGEASTKSTEVNAQFDEKSVTSKSTDDLKMDAEPVEDVSKVISTTESASKVLMEGKRDSFPSKSWIDQIEEIELNTPEDVINHLSGAAVLILTEPSDEDKNRVLESLPFLNENRPTAEDKETFEADLACLKSTVTDASTDVIRERTFTLENATYDGQDMEITIKRTSTKKECISEEMVDMFSSSMYYVSRRVKIPSKNVQIAPGSEDDVTHEQSSESSAKNHEEQKLADVPQSSIQSTDLSSENMCSLEVGKSKVPLVEYEMSSQAKAEPCLKTTGKFRVLNSDKEFGDIYSDESITQMSNTSVDVPNILGSDINTSAKDIPLDYGSQTAIKSDKSVTNSKAKEGRSGKGDPASSRFSKVIRLKGGTFGFIISTEGEYRIFTHIFMKNRWSDEKILGKF